jgi:hypothetical protein
MPRCRFAYSQRLLLLLLVCPAGFCPAIYGWSADGHRIVAQIAESHLDPRAAAAVQQILGPDRHLADISSRADDMRNEQKETAPWHFVNIPIGASAFNRALYCPANQCVVGAVERFRDQLKARSSLQASYEALYNVVHFIGDLHEPLHGGDRGDRGGNDVNVEFLGKPTNLHRVWDSGILEALDRDWEYWARKLGKISRVNTSAWSRGTVVDWAMESHDLSRDVVYRFEQPSSGSAVLGKAYLRRGSPVVQQQLAKAGIRLAYVLNEVYK